MKRLIFLTIVSIMLSTFVFRCVKNTDGIMTLTATARETGFELWGSGTVTVDWGDGSEKETVELPGEGNVKFKRVFSDIIPRTITITGKNVTGLDCSSNVSGTALGYKTTESDSASVKLIRLSCRDNKITALDVSRNRALTYLSCSGNLLTELDVSRNTALTGLFCDNNQLTELDVSKNTMLTFLRCCYNLLTELDVSRNAALTRLFCMYNHLTELDVSRNTALEELFCSYNHLTELDVSQNTALAGSLGCSNNQLTALDVSRNPTLRFITCNGNRLTALDVSQNTVLSWLDCSDNQFTSEALNDLFNTLHDNVIPFYDDSVKFIMEKGIGISNNPGSAYCEPGIAEHNGWGVSGYTAGADENTVYATLRTWGRLVIEGKGTMEDMACVIIDDNGHFIYSWNEKRDSITRIIIDSDVTSIGQNAFYCFNRINSVIIANSVKKIGCDAFSGCSKLTSIVIPNCVTEIGSRAFADCNALTSITVLSLVPPTMRDDVFKNVNTNVRLYVPVGSLEAYNAADGWKEFTCIKTIK